MVELLVVYCVWAHCILCLGAMHPSMNQRNYGLLEGRTSRVVGGLNREKDFFVFYIETVVFLGRSACLKYQAGLGGKIA